MPESWTERPLRILLVDDHAGFRRQTREVLDEQDDMQVVAEAADGEEALRQVRALYPDQLDLVLMDVEMPRLDGVDATRRIRAAYPDLPVVMLTISTLDRDLFGAAEAGAIGFLSKSLAPAAFVRTLRDFRREHALPMSRTMAARVLAHLQRAAMAEAGEREEAAPSSAVLELLSEREQEILALMAEGARDREIADRLVVAETTVKTHVRNILRKLDARNRTEAVARFRGRA